MNEASKRLSKIIERICVLIVTLTVAYQVGIMEGKDRMLRELSNLSKDQKIMVEQIINSKVSNKKIEKSRKELDEARTSLEKAKQAQSKGDKQTALDWLITARGHIENVDKTAFDVREIVVGLADVQKSLLSK